MDCLLVVFSTISDPPSGLLLAAVALLFWETKPISLRRKKNCFFRSSIIFRVLRERYLLRQNCLSLPCALASSYPRNASNKVKWSPENKEAKSINNVKWYKCIFNAQFQQTAHKTTHTPRRYEKKRGLRTSVLFKARAKARFVLSASSLFSKGDTNGERKVMEAAMVSTGSRHWKTVPKIIIFPMRGSTGSDARWTPFGICW